MGTVVGERSGRDLFLEALRSEIVAGTEVLSTWVSHVHAQGEIAALFEFGAWLCGLNAFFDWKRLPLREKEKNLLHERSFAPEIRVARLALQQAEHCALRLCCLSPETAAARDMTRRTGMESAGVRSFPMGRVFEQANPMESLTRLLESIQDLKVMIDAVQDPMKWDFQLYLSLGRTFRRDLRDCRFIDMLLAQRFWIQFDCMDSAVLSAVLKSITDDRERHNVALALLYLHRFLRYLELVSSGLRDDMPLHHFLVLFCLLHEQTDVLCDFVQSHFQRGRRSNAKLRDAADLMVHSLRLETQRAFERELVFLAAEDDPSMIYAKVENSHGLLRNCYQSSVVTLIHAFDESVDAKSVFPSMVEGLQQGQKLTGDLWDLRSDLKGELDRENGFDLSMVLDRITRFRESSLRFLMYQDWGEFERFSDSLIAAGNEIEARALLRRFVRFLEVLVQEVSKRSVLQ